MTFALLVARSHNGHWIGGCARSMDVDWGMCPIGDWPRHYAGAFCYLPMICNI